MNHPADFDSIAQLDLDPIKLKLMHVESGEGWTLEKANAVEGEYRRFLYLMKKFPEVQAAPLADVDTFWHYHILDTLKYAEDCHTVYGHFLHHYPYVGLGGEADEDAHQRLGQRMKELYETTFGEPYLRGLAAWCARPDVAAHAWCARPDMRAAWCARPDMRAAWCARPDGQATSAWCARPDAPPAGTVQTAWPAFSSSSAAPANVVRPRLTKAA